LLRRHSGERVEINPKAIVSEKIGDFHFSYHAGEFSQNDPYAFRKLLDFVIQGAMGSKYLIDTYCAVGVFGIMAAKYFERVVGMAVGEIAGQFAKQNAKNHHIDNIGFVSGIAEQVCQC